VISNVIYQLLENVAYLAQKGVVSKKWIEKYGGVDRWYIWSTRGWFGHIFFEWFVLWREHVLRKRRMAAKRAAANNVETKDLKVEEAEEVRKEVRSWKKSLVNNTIWAPLCIHWCLEKGIGIPENLIGVISFMAGAWGLRDSWAATANA
jgi:Peroxisomal biogenesis factor 11 (PEX11)